jgi:cytoskeleton protein RodZ
MKNTGQMLKEAREKKGISIAEVSLATKINSKILNAIEQGNLSKLPPKTFLRGFVHSYAQFLQLDVDQVMKSFHEEMGPTRPAAESPEASLAASAPTAERPSSSSMSRGGGGSFAKLGAVFGIIVLVIVIILLKKKMDSYESESIPAPVETVVTTATPSPTPAVESVFDSPRQEATSTLSTAVSANPVATLAPVATATPTPKPIATPTATSTPIPKPSPTATATPTPAPKPSLTPSPSPKATATPVAAVVASPSPTATPMGRVQDVTIEALDDVEITAVIDGESRSIKLAADQVHTIKAKRKVSLQLSDGGAVSIIVNGIDRGVPGDLGKPKKVDIP